MNDIPNTEFITVKYDDKGVVDVFVGGKPATTYRGQDIEEIKYVKSVFKWELKKNPFIAEFQIMSSITEGEYAETGNPSAEPGPTAWGRIALKDGTTADWVWDGKRVSAELCAKNCAREFAYQVCENSDFRKELYYGIKRPRYEIPWPERLFKKLQKRIRQYQ